MKILLDDNKSHTVKSITLCESKYEVLYLVKLVDYKDIVLSKGSIDKELVED
jgi:hypothetical protein